MDGNNSPTHYATGDKVRNGLKMAHSVYIVDQPNVTKALENADCYNIMNHVHCTSVGGHGDILNNIKCFLYGRGGPCTLICQ